MSEVHQNKETDQSGKDRNLDANQGKWVDVFDKGDLKEKGEKESKSPWLDIPIEKRDNENRKESSSPWLKVFKKSEDAVEKNSDVEKNKDSEDNGKGENKQNDSEKRKELEKVLDDYIKDIKDKSECPDTISDNPFSVEDLKYISPEENEKLRDEFDNNKADLKKKWEQEHGRPWPKYEKDVYSINGKLIRKAGDDYDAHHIQPLGLGGKNEASNITPLRADVHYDSQGVHANNSPYKKLETLVKE